MNINLLYYNLYLKINNESVSQNGKDGINLLIITYIYNFYYYNYYYYYYYYFLSK